MDSVDTSDIPEAGREWFERATLRRPTLRVGKAYLIAFEKEVADRFNAAKIRAPVHLSGGNEEQLIDVFEDVKSEDWVISTWRSHYHCLLKGVPPEQLMADIVAGKSITLNYPEHRILSSAIVGGGLPIAAGIALGIKRRNGHERVWAFLGDMAHRGGMFHEVCQFANGHNLPIRFVVEDNGISVCTDTAVSWGTERIFRGKVRDYSYKLPWPHSGAGHRVNF
jgi:pyruvate dehydrogenase E1 component alpha subunit